MGLPWCLGFTRGPGGRPDRKGCAVLRFGLVELTIVCASFALHTVGRGDELVSLQRYNPFNAGAPAVRCGPGRACRAACAYRLPRSVPGWT
eukprot:5909788-Prymnesium_polylepis.1